MPIGSHSRSSSSRSSRSPRSAHQRSCSGRPYRRGSRAPPELLAVTVPSRRELALALRGVPAARRRPVRAPGGERRLLLGRLAERRQHALLARAGPVRRARPGHRAAGLRLPAGAHDAARSRAQGVRHPRVAAPGDGAPVRGADRLGAVPAPTHPWLRAARLGSSGRAAARVPLDRLHADVGHGELRHARRGALPARRGARGARAAGGAARAHRRVARPLSARVVDVRGRDASACWRPWRCTSSSRRAGTRCAGSRSTPAWWRWRWRSSCPERRATRSRSPTRSTTPA